MDAVTGTEPSRQPTTRRRRRARRSRVRWRRPPRRPLRVRPRRPPPRRSLARPTTRPRRRVGRRSPAPPRPTRRRSPARAARRADACGLGDDRRARRGRRPDARPLRPDGRSGDRRPEPRALRPGRRSRDRRSDARPFRPGGRSGDRRPDARAHRPGRHFGATPTLARSADGLDRARPRRRPTLPRPAARRSRAPPQADAPATGGPTLARSAQADAPAHRRPDARALRRRPTLRRTGGPTLARSAAGGRSGHRRPDARALRPGGRSARPTARRSRAPPRRTLRRTDGPTLARSAQADAPATGGPTLARSAETDAPATGGPTLARSAQTDAPATDGPTLARSAQTDTPTTGGPTLARSARTDAPATASGPKLARSARADAPAATGRPTLARSARTDAPATAGGPTLARTGTDLAARPDPGPLRPRRRGRRGVPRRWRRDQRARLGLPGADPRAFRRRRRHRDVQLRRGARWFADARAVARSLGCRTRDADRRRPARAGPRDRRAVRVRTRGVRAAQRVARRGRAREPHAQPDARPNLELVHGAEQPQIARSAAERLADATGGTVSHDGDGGLRTVHFPAPGAGTPPAAATALADPDHDLARIGGPRSGVYACTASRQPTADRRSRPRRRTRRTNKKRPISARSCTSTSSTASSAICSPSASRWAT